VVTPNKCGPSADRPLARAITAAQAATGAVLHDATTVGAQLPLLQTLRDLRAAGDEVERFEAVLSGTLSYVLGNVQAGAALSTAVSDAVAQGYAEPHPACDLSGEDAARKLVILLRALGHDIELRDVERVPLVDAALLEERDSGRLLAGLQAADETWRARAAIADSRRERWIYRASFDRAGAAPGRARVAPERVALEHPLARLAPCENALILHSAFYRAAPLTIAGPGAGIDLTAAGVFADVLAVAQRHPRSLSAHGAVDFEAVVAVEEAA
jgi:aspartokinase/homoserine dehydrogenase 1